jgi:hypothetical protein
LLDGIQLHLDVIIINVPVFLHDQGYHLVPIGWHRLQPLKPFLSSIAQIQLGDLEQFVNIEIAHFSSHGESLCPITDVFIIASPKQIVHPLGASHSANVLLQSKASRKKIVMIQFENLN